VSTGEGEGEGEREGKNMDFRIMCLSCGKATKFDALSTDHRDKPCDKCGELL